MPTSVAWVFVLLLLPASSLPVPPDEGSAPVGEYRFFCRVLGREVPYSLALPPGPAPPGGFPLVLFLHGDGRHHRTLTDDDSCREVLRRYRLAVVLPNGDRSWYLDSPVEPRSRYQSMLVELLHHVQTTFPVSRSPHRTGVGGWSMGGFGAVHFAETHPERVGAVATTIGLLDFPNPALPPDQNYPISPLFGTDTTGWRRVNPLNGLEALRGKSLLFIAGKGAFDYRMNQHFHERLRRLRIPHEFLEVEGKHDFPTVRRSLPTMLAFFDENLNRP